MRVKRIVPAPTTALVIGHAVPSANGDVVTTSRGAGAGYQGVHPLPGSGLRLLLEPEQLCSTNATSIEDPIGMGAAGVCHESAGRSEMLVTSTGHT